MIHSVSCEFGGRTLTLETGKLAKQANGAVLVSYGDTRVLATACVAKEPKQAQDFFPLTVEYVEKYYGVGKIPGSFFRREGRPTEEQILVCRMIDRPIRPLFPEGFMNEVQIIATVISVDPEADAEVAASIGVSAALSISDIPFSGPTAAVRIGRMNGQFVINPKWSQMENKELDFEIFVAGTAKAVTMVEGGAREVPEEDILGAILHGHEEIKNIIGTINDLTKKAGKTKMAFQPLEVNTTIENEVSKISKSILQKGLQTKEKEARYEIFDQAQKAAMEAIVPETLKKNSPDEAAEKTKHVKNAIEKFKYNMMREKILQDSYRIDGRGTKDIRNISTEAGLLPRTHGSSLFTRGETQVMAAVTLGTADDEQIIDSLYQDSTKQFLFHYNFPPFSVGECGRLGGQSRREVGHGNLAARAIKAVLPDHEKFPYTIRVVCETLESNGSSSMGSVCSSSMALMDAGVPISKPVAGIAMGLIKENDRVAILSDILGDEDHLGDMDFKVAGTSEGVTSIQMDIKIEGVDENIMRSALQQAREGRIHILGEMAKSIETPRPELNKYAPKIITMTIKKEKIGAVIGPKGQVIKDIIATTGCKIDINDEGIINIATNDNEMAKKAVQMITNIVTEAEVGKTYTGEVKKIVEFGAFVEILPNQEGLLHVSEIAHERVNNVEDYLHEGDKVEVKVLEIDERSGKMRLSRKELLPMPAGGEQRRPSGPSQGFGNRDRSGPPRGGRPGGGGGHSRGGRSGGPPRSRF